MILFRSDIFHRHVMRDLKPILKINWKMFSQWVLGKFKKPLLLFP